VTTVAKNRENIGDLINNYKFISAF